MKTLMLLMTLVQADAKSEAPQPDVLLLDFTAGYCQPCQQMLPLLQRMENDKFPVRRIDITEDHELARRFKVDRVPTLVLLVEGQEVQRFIGLTDEAELRGAMNSAARKLAESREDVSGLKSPVVPGIEVSEEGAVSHEDVSSNELSDKGGMSIGRIFSGLLRRGDRSAFEHPSLRGQSPDAVAPATTSLATASAATVRVKVLGKSKKDGATLQDVGTGTIIYSAEGQAIVLTCAHVFFDIVMADAAIDVEVFQDGKPVRFPAKVVGGDHNADVAILKLQSAKLLPHVRLTAVAPTLVNSQKLTSFGCNAGADPTRLDTELVDINRYDGPANLVCTSDPASGRSGGGLFNSAGELVGVCSCADRKRSEGLYMAHAAILGLVSRVNLNSILLATPAVGDDTSNIFDSIVDTDPVPSPPIVVPQNPIAPLESDEATVGPTMDGASSSNDARTADVTEIDETIEGLTDAPLFQPGGSKTPNAAPVNRSRGPEITILIDDKTPGSEKKVIVIPQASPWLLELLTGENADGVSATATAALRPIVPDLAARTRESGINPSHSKVSDRTLVP